MRASKGFSIIEIVVVIVILAVISAVAMSRFISGNTFDEIVIRDQIISLSRVALQSSRGRSSVSLSVQPNGAGDEVTITVSDSGGSIESATVSMDTTTLTGDINETDSCATTNGADSITNAAPMTLNFGALGDLGVSGVTGSTGAVTSAARICINEEAEMSVCVSPSGFAYAGDCDV